MGISTVEFRTAMEIYGAKRLNDQKGSRCGIVPCFIVKGVVFLHSGSYYVIQKDSEVPARIMAQAMSVFGEKYPGGRNYWHGGIHTVQGLLTLTSMLEGKYSKELVDKLANKTYKRLLESSLIHTSAEFPYQINTPKMKLLHRKLEEFCDAVNPFGNTEFVIKDPIQYIETVTPSITLSECDNPYVNVSLRNGSSRMWYEKDANSWSYDVSIIVPKNDINYNINMCHSYSIGGEYRDSDELVTLDCFESTESFVHPDKIDLIISLKTGLAWKSNGKAFATPVSNEQIDTMIAYLDLCNKTIKTHILSYMINSLE